VRRLEARPGSYKSTAWELGGWPQEDRLEARPGGYKGPPACPAGRPQKPRAGAPAKHPLADSPDARAGGRAIKATTEVLLDPAQVDAVLQPRNGLVAEARTPDGDFVEAEGPLQSYRRVVTVTGAENGRCKVTQSVEFQVGVPYFSAVFALPLRWALAPVMPRTRQPWWAPPERLPRRAAEVLATLCALAVVVGYVGSLLTITMTYAASEFGADKTAQGVALAVVRANVALALGILLLADRQGRRRLILASAGGAAALTALGAVAPSLPWLVATQILAVALTAALLVLVGVMAAEEMPAGSRAWALAVLTMCAGLGSGLATAALPLASLGLRGWRIPYAGALVFLPLVASTRRHLPESRRWQARRPAQAQPAAQSPAGTGAEAATRSPPEAAAHAAPETPAGTPTSPSNHRRRLALLCSGAFLFALFATPSSQFQNEYLRTERAFSPTRISVFSLFTGTIGGLGVLLGGRLADLRGRRLVAAVGAGAGIVTTVALYGTRGWPLWVWGVADSLLGYAVAPALGVYGPELFPTRQRSRATGVVALAFAAGGVAGLVFVGTASQRFGSFAPAMALLGIGPALLVVLIVRAYPETAQRTLEELNPDDPAP
jgi:MFS family permease